MIRRLFFIIWIVCAAVFSADAQTELHGVDFTDHHYSALDSALLRRNSVLYSGRDAWGTVSDANLTIFNKWVKDKEKYYPMMKEAWTYCLNHAPYQYRLYKDGILFYQWMIDGANDDLSRSKYVSELMALYDKQIQNLDSINAHVRRISDRSSKGNMMIRKAMAYEYYVLGKEQEGVEYYSTQRKTAMYPMYREAVNVLQNTFEEGADNGGDVDMIGLRNYFLYAVWHCVDTLNAHLTNDSISNKVRAEAKATLLREYNFMKDFCNKQVQSLGADYIDSLSVEGGDSIEVVQNKVVAPYKELMAFCDENMENLQINVIIQTLADADLNYGEELESHKDSLAWLYRLKTTCENTIDFSPDNIFYPFYEDVEKLYDEALEKTKQSTTITQKQIRKYEGNPYFAKAQPLYNTMIRFSRSGKTNMDNTTFYSGLLCIYYLNQAGRTDPGNATKYNKMKAWVRKGVSQEAFFKGVQRGQIVTVNGVTFSASF